MKDKSNTVTIITAVKNGKNCLAETILSVANYPYRNIEMVIIDGKSDDGTIDVIRKYENHIDHWVSESDSGLYDAYNKGWEYANKENYILFLGAGDRLIDLPTTELDLLFGKVIYGRVNIGQNRLFVSKVNKMSRFANTLHHQAMLVPKMLHPSPPFNTNYDIYADFDFNQRMIKNNIPFVYSDNFLTYAKLGGVSTDYSKESFMIAYKNFGLKYGLMAYLFYLYQKSKGIEKYFAH